MSTKNTRWLPSLAAVLVLALAACGGTDEETPSGSDNGADDTEGQEDGDSGEVTAVRVANAAPAPSVAQAPYSSLPSLLGYDADEGLDFESLDLDGSGAVAQAVEAGSADMGLVGTEVGIAAINSGMEAKLIFMAITGNVQVPYVLADSDIQTFADFEGRTVGVLGLTAALVDVIKGSVSDAGADPESVEFVTPGIGAEALRALETGRIDVLGFPDSFAAEVAARGAELRPILDETFENLGATYGLLVPTETLEERPEVAIGVARAMARATLFATLNTEAAVRLHWEGYPDLVPAGVDEEEALATQMSIGEFRMAAMQPVDGLWGGATEDQLQVRLDLAVSGGSVEEGAMSIDDFWTDEYLEEINDFDEAQVEADAAAGGPAE